MDQTLIARFVHPAHVWFGQQSQRQYKYRGSADKAAKEAARGIGLDIEKLPTQLQSRIPTNTTAAKRTRRMDMAQEWAARLGGTERTGRMRLIDDTYPSFNFSSRAADLLRQSYAALVQLRVGHFPLATYLNRFKLAESPGCVT